MCFPCSYVEISYDAREFSYFLALRGPLLSNGMDPNSPSPAIILEIYEK
jgi:hypothetical protein